MEKILLRTLLVGTGGRGRWALAHCTAENGYQLVGLCDPHPPFLEEARRLTGLPANAAFLQLDPMIAAVPADVLIICSPTATHAAYAQKGFDAGLSVLTEKGMAPDWPTAGAMVLAAARSSARFCVAQNYRYRPLERAISRLLRDEAEPGHVGRIFWVDYVEHRVRPEPRTLTYPFASVWDMSCHHFDNMIGWFGPVASVTARAVRAPWSPYVHPNNTAAWLQFASGPLVCYAHTHDATRAELRIRIQGERGALFAAEDSLEFSAPPLRNFGVCPPLTVLLTGEPGEVGVLRDFHRYVTEGIEPGISGRHNLEVMALCQLLVLAAEQGRTVARSELALPL